jgi:hypothetical protein
LSDAYVIAISVQALTVLTMKSIFRFVIAAWVAMLPIAEPTTAQSARLSGAPSNTVPGGITLVPGTVVMPQVGGTAVTGRVPLAGTVGSEGVPDYNSGAPPRDNSGALYPVVPRTGLAPVLGNRTSLPQALAPETSLLTTPACPSGVSVSGGGC